jgi:hypothetical protein
MKYTTIRAIFLLILLASSSFTSLFFTEAHAADNLVTVTASNNDMTTTLKFTNNAEDVSDINSVILQIGQGGNFKSFKTDSGWFGIKSSANTVTFTSTNPIKVGQSANFIIKTDQSNPDIMWKAIDIKNNELGSGEIGSQSPGTQSPGTQSPGTQSTNHVGILDGSSFRIIPSTPSSGIDVRVVGQSFSSNANLDLYIGDNKIDSFTTNNGNFIITTKIPDDQPPGSVSFFIKDQNGNSRTFSTIIQPMHHRANITNQHMPLTLNADSIYHRGESKTISGTATPGITLTISVLDSNNNTVTTFETSADKTGHYSYTTVVPIDAPFGEYTVVVSDGKSKISKDHNIVTTHQIVLSTSQQEVDPGNTIIINGTSISNEPVSVRIKDPTGN